MRVMLVFSPRYYWPFVSEGDNYLVPQALVYLGAALRKAGHEVSIYDCMPLKMGWRSLEQAMRNEDPDVVCVGENHALYAHEAMRVIEMAKDVIPRAKRVVGGAHFTNLFNKYMGEHPIDFVVCAEGEYTLCALVEEIGQPKPNYGSVAGIVYRESDDLDSPLLKTPARHLIEDLDELAMPAYDLVPMDQYGTSKLLFSPGGTTIHHSRGCTASCSFCVWWTQMAHRTETEDGHVSLRPRWRTKSVDKCIAEIEELYYKYDKRCYVWVDESWNIDARWNDQFAEEIIRSGMDITWFAFMRSDCIIRDEKRGIMEKLVAAGLRHLCIGVERAEDERLKEFNKGFYNNDQLRETFRILDKYPSIFKQATFIVGTRYETRESMFRQAELARELNVDYPAFHPITPVPGTPVFDQAMEEGWITLDDFTEFDWMTPMMDSDYMTKDEISRALYDINRKFVTPKWLAKGLLSKDKYKRDMYMWWIKVALGVSVDSVKARINPIKENTFTNLVKPEWYDT
jgi:anaerobic magnesium-protoporphyrin IX monomethyl ester cyclase